MLPNPFSDAGRVYDEVQQVKRELYNKTNNWEFFSLKGKVDALSQDVKTLSETVMDIYNKLDNIKNEMEIK